MPITHKGAQESQPQEATQFAAELAQPNSFRHIWIHRSLKIERNPQFVQRSALTESVIKSNPAFMMENARQQVNLEEALDLALLIPFNPLSVISAAQGDVGGKHRIIPY